jgi:hypothetical protein
VDVTRPPRFWKPFLRIGGRRPADRAGIHDLGKSPSSLIDLDDDGIIWYTVLGAIARHSAKVAIRSRT